LPKQGGAPWYSLLALCGVWLNLFEQPCRRRLFTFADMALLGSITGAAGKAGDCFGALDFDVAHHEGRRSHTWPAGTLGTPRTTHHLPRTVGAVVALLAGPLVRFFTHPVIVICAARNRAVSAARLTNDRTTYNRRDK
jgi:hypothetical protein